MNDITKGHRQRQSMIKPKGRDYSEEAETRDCLQCLKPFNSSWYGNRICEMCKGTELFGAVQQRTFNDD